MPFKPGVSGNPGGRPKVVGTIRKLAQENSPEAFKVLVQAMNEADKWPERIAAARSILKLAGCEAAAELGDDAEDAPDLDDERALRLVNGDA